MRDHQDHHARRRKGFPTADGEIRKLSEFLATEMGN
jgi:hypothetical protein